MPDRLLAAEAELQRRLQVPLGIELKPCFSFETNGYLYLWATKLPRKVGWQLGGLRCTVGCMLWPAWRGAAAACTLPEHLLLPSLCKCNLACDSLPCCCRVR